MLLFVVRIGIIIAIAKLWEMGGQHNGKWYRTVWIPIILAVFFSITKQWWLFPVMCLVTQSVRIGYGNYEEGEDNCWIADLIKDHNGWYVRAIWGFLVAVAISYPFGIWWWGVLIYTSVNYLVSRLRITLPWSDWLVGAFLGGIVFI